MFEHIWITAGTFYAKSQVPTGIFNYLLMFRGCYKVLLQDWVVPQKIVEGKERLTGNKKWQLDLKRRKLQFSLPRFLHFHLSPSSFLTAKKDLVLIRNNNIFKYIFCCKQLYEFIFLIIRFLKLKFKLANFYELYFIY